MTLDIDRKIKDLEEAFTYWRGLLRSLPGIGAILVLPGSVEMYVHQYALELLSALMNNKCYDSIMVVSDDDYVIEFAGKVSTVDVMFHNCTSKLIESLCFLQALDGYWDNIYVNQTELIDDADPFLLTGEYSQTKRDIVAKVFMRLSPFTSAEETMRDVRSVREPHRIIDFRFYDEWIPTDIPASDGRKEYISDKIKELEQSKLLSPANQMVLYGDSKTALMCIEALKSYEDVKIADKSPAKHGQTRNSAMIYHPDEILIPYDRNIRIFITIYSYKEVAERLLYLGYELGKQVFIFNYKKDIATISETDFCHKIEEKIRNGFAAYNNLRQQYRTEKILLSPWAASGDIYIDCLYLKDYLNENQIDDYIIVVPTVAAQKVAKLFGFDTALVTEKEAFAILEFARAFGFDTLNICNINVNVGVQRIGQYCKIMDFNTFHQKLVFQTNKKKYLPAMYQESSDAFFEQYHLKKGRTILVAPYSATLGNIPKEVCISLVEELKKKGYSVCTNVGKGELPIPGTEGLFIPYAQVLDFVNKAGGFIGMRSGLCDIVSSTSSRMAVVHKEFVFNYFSLDKMSLKTENILELVLERETSESLSEKIVSFFSVPM